MSGIRVNQAKNFKGEPYATEKFVRDMVQLPEGVNTLIDPDTGKLAEELNPGITIQLKGEDVEQNATKINFIGNCMVVTNGEGFVTARIGDNLNSSNFNTKDGQTDGIVTRSTGGTATSTATPAIDSATNDTTVCWKKGTNTITIKPNGLIHFDNNTSTTFEIDLITGKEGSQTTKKIVFGPITGNATLTGHENTIEGAEVSEITLAISSFAQEAKTAEGATGYQGMATFTASVQTLLSENIDFKFVVRHINGAEGTKIWNTDTYIFFINDTNTKPVVTSASFSISGATAIPLSGVTALKGGSISVNVAGITNLANPAAVNNGKITVTAQNNDANSNWFATITSNGTTGFTGYTGASTDSASYTTSKSITGTGHLTAANIVVAAQNINGTGSTVKGSASQNLFLLNVSKNTPTGTAEYFQSETNATYPRKKNDCTTNWDSSWSLASGDGTEGLMFLGGNLVYPKGDYTGANDGISSIEGANQPNYSALTGDRSYVRWFAKIGSLSGGKFTVSHTASIQSFVTAGTLNFEVSKDGSQWYDIARLSGIGTAFNWGSTSSSMTFVFTDGVATNGMWFRVRMASSSVTATLTQIVME